MSRCPLCNSKGECLEYCGWEIKDVWEDVVQKLESKNTKLKEQLAVAVEFLSLLESFDFQTGETLREALALEAGLREALKQIKEMDK